jgi:glycosyltransferase involved in cell wall biosynthesis
MKMPNLSILVCSYNTPEVLKTCLKSWKRYNTGHDNEWLISENSTNEETVEMLNWYSIPYFRNAGMRHADGVDFLIRQCKTDYALLIDSDVIFRKDILPIWNTIKDIDFVIAGEWCGDRGGKLLYPRINPWFCFLNVKAIKEHDWKFGDDLMNEGKPKGERLWDVGSLLYDSVIKAELKVVDMEKDMDAFYYHYEGMSWRKNNPDYRPLGLEVEKKYQFEIDAHVHIDLKPDPLTELGLKHKTDKAVSRAYWKLVCGVVNQ